jgi:hypothetical protein
VRMGSVAIQLRRLRCTAAEAPDGPSIACRDPVQCSCHTYAEARRERFACNGKRKASFPTCTCFLATPAPPHEGSRLICVALPRGRRCMRVKLHTMPSPSPSFARSQTSFTETRSAQLKRKSAFVIRQRRSGHGRAPTPDPAIAARGIEEVIAVTCVHSRSTDCNHLASGKKCAIRVYSQ